MILQEPESNKIPRVEIAAKKGADVKGNQINHRQKN